MRTEHSAEMQKQHGDRHTPVMQQYLRCKAQYPDTILFFRLGDFYEMFFEDAERASRMLDLTLTSRGKDRQGENIPMAGVPHHAALGYICKLLQLGQRVALCEQMADPSTVKGVVPREVVRVITPGLVLEHDALDAREHNYFVTVAVLPEGLGLAALELSTAEFFVCELSSTADALAELGRLQPREVLINHNSLALELSSALEHMLRRAVVRMDAEDTDVSEFDDNLKDWISKEASTVETKDFNLCAQYAMTLALSYVRDHQPSQMHTKFRLQRYETGSFVGLDATAVRNLEIVSTLSGERVGSLVHLLDQTCSSMGARLFRRHLLAPLADLAIIRQRHDAIEALMKQTLLRKQVRDALSAIQDLERLATRVESALATPRELGALRDGLKSAQTLMGLVRDHADVEVTRTLMPVCSVESCHEVLERLEAVLVDSPPAAIGAAEVFKKGVDPRIDELRGLSSSSKDIILELEQLERARTGISSLKVKYTRAFGYYIEVSRSKATNVPVHYRRRQTLVGSERYITDELEALQIKILTADEQLYAIEETLFNDLRSEVAKQAMRIRQLARGLAALDVSACWAELALRHDYVRPVMDTSSRLELLASRHPVVEKLAEAGSFVPNDITLDAQGESLAILTGPNMAGKSTMMRQVALSVIMAQAGGYVAAKSAHIGLVDRVFTRIGASDNLSRGQSTFMVEMQETANLLHGATSRSLILLDEIGRGTSTYDGLAIAWAVAEHLARQMRCRTLFATHYHELCALVDQSDGHAKNYNVLVHDHEGKIVFLHKLVPGAVSRSYGVEVAELAGLPKAVLDAAKRKLAALEQPGISSTHSSQGRVEVEDRAPSLNQDAAFEQLRAELLALDLDHTSPIEGLSELYKIRARLLKR